MPLAPAAPVPPDTSGDGSTAAPSARLLVRDLVVITVSVGVIAGLIKLAWRKFTFFGDNAESFFPLWHMYGAALRTGHPFLFNTNGWGAANVVGEAAYGVFNPVTIVDSVLLSFTDWIAVGGFLIIVQFLVLLGWGVYLLARSYEATRPVSTLVAVIAPFAGYTLFYEAGNWASGLMAITWVVHFWWAVRRFSRREIGPLAPLAFGYLAATVGNPYSVVGILVVLAAVGGERLLQRDVRRFGQLVLIGLLVGAFVVLTYVALLAVLTQVDRPIDGAPVSNNNYLTPTLGDLLSFSAPTYLPRFWSWNQTHDLVPSAYLSWIILPALPWIRWRSLGGWRPRVSLVIATLLFAAVTLGPDHLWLFRWPIRFIEYLFIGVLVVFAVLLSHGVGRTYRLHRTVLSGAGLAVGLYASWASTPQLWSVHVAVTAVVAVLVVILWLGRSRFGGRGMLAVGLVGTAIIAPWQGNVFGWSGQDVAPGVNQTPPASLATVRDAWKGVSGRILQVADIERFEGTDVVATGQLVFGNTGAAAGLDILNRYTGINFTKFKDGMAFDYRGTVGDWFPLTYLWEPVSSAYPVPLADALGLDTIVVDAHRRDADQLPKIAPGWHIASRDAVRIVLTRDAPITHPALHAQAGVQATHATANGNDASFEVRSASGGWVLMDRLAWNGYRATLNGARLPIDQAPYGLLVVRIPPGAAGTVHVTYTIPGLAPAAWAAGAAGVLGLGWQLVWVVRRRRRRTITAA